MLKAISLIAALVPFVLVGYFLIKLLEIKAREPSTMEPFSMEPPITEPPTRQYELLQRYGYPSLVLIFSCIVLLGHLQPKWIERMYFEPFLGFSLYLCVSSRMHSALQYFVGFTLCAFVSVLALLMIEHYKLFLYVTVFASNENIFMESMVALIIVCLITCTIRFTLLRRFAISPVQLFISIISIFYLKLFTALTLLVLGIIIIPRAIPRM